MPPKPFLLPLSEEDVVYMQRLLAQLESDLMRQGGTDCVRMSKWCGRILKSLRQARGK